MKKRIGKLGRHVGAGLWYCRIDGRQRYIGTKETTESEAIEIYKKLEAEMKLKEASPDTNDRECTIESLFNYYLNNAVLPKDKKNTVDRKRYAKDFIAVFREMKSSEVKPFMIEKFIMDNEYWNHTTKGNVCKHISAIFNWLIKALIIDKNPVKWAKKPKPFVRGKEFVIEPDEYEMLLAHCLPNYKDIMVLLWETGSRPDEILSCRVEDYNPSDGMLEKKQSKKEHLGKLREILLSSVAEEVIKRVVGERKSGLLFTSVFGNKVSPDVFNQYLKRLARRLGILHPVIGYSYRHSASVKWHRAGLSVDQIATLLGNTPAVASKHYIHGKERLKELRSKIN